MTNRTRALGAGIAGGMLAGAAVGALEAVGVWIHGHGAGEVPAIAWALVAYGAVGGALGLGAGVLAAVVGTDGFGLALAAVGGVLAFAVGRFRVIRDVFLEQLPPGPMPKVVQAAALAAVVVAAFAIWRALRGADARRTPLTRPVVTAVVIVLIAAAWAGGTRLVPTPAPAPLVARASGADLPNVLLIMVDTLRADHLSCYGGSPVQTPHIDQLASGGLRYANTFSQASWTRPSVATILTGLYPSSHGAVHKADRLPDRVDTLAEMLQRGGYRTVGFANNANVSAAFNFQQGFDEYHYLAPDFFFGASEAASQLAVYSGLRLVRERFLSHYVDVHHYYQPAEVVTATVRDWLDHRPPGKEPLFLFVHYMDPHDPYFVHPFNGEGYARVANPNPPAELAEKLHRVYAGEVAYLDEHLGVLFDDLRKLGLWDRTLVVLTADHGEEFHEHGGWWHGTTLYDEQVHVPLLVKPARYTGPGKVVEELATSLDITPTVLASARLPLFAEEDLEGNVLQAVRTRESKLISANPGNPRGLAPEELYDLTRDPGEHTNTVATAPAQAEMMRAELGKSVLQARAHAGATERAGAEAAGQHERLKALGYVD